MLEAEHSPLPWSSDDGTIYDANDTLVFSQGSCVDAKDDEFATLACNAHYDLVAACEVAEEAIRRDCVWMLAGVGEVRRQLLEVIAKAKGEK